MSILTKLKTKQSANQAMENVAVQISAYEGEFFFGIRIDTGEEIKVKLRDFNTNSKFARPTIKSFQSQGNTHCAIGGVILFDGCYIEADGVYSAKWASVLSSEKGKAFVVSGMARLSSGMSASNKQWMKVDYIKPGATPIEDEAQFVTVVTQGLNPATKHSNPFVMIRITDSDGERAMLYANVSKYKGKENYMETMSAEDSFKEFAAGENYPVLIEGLNDPSVKIEVAHAVSIFAGPATLNNYFNNDSEKTRLEAHYLVNGTDDEGNESFYYGYTDSIVTMRTHGDGTPFITHIKPIKANAKGLATVDAIPD